MAYKLQLPTTSSIHPIFHLSLLKRHKGNLPTASASLPPDDNLMHTPESVLDHRFKTKQNRVVKQLLIKWAGWPAELAT